MRKVILAVALVLGIAVGGGVIIYNTPIAPFQTIALACLDEVEHELSVQGSDYQVKATSSNYYMVVARESPRDMSGHKRIMLSLIPQSDTPLTLSAWSTEKIVWMCFSDSISLYDYARSKDAAYKATAHSVISQDIIQWNPVPVWSTEEVHPI